MSARIPADAYRRTDHPWPFTDTDNGTSDAHIHQRVPTTAADEVASCNIPDTEPRARGRSDRGEHPLGRSTRSALLGHGIRAGLAIGVAPETSVAEAHEVADRVRHALSHDVEHLSDITIERPTDAHVRPAPRPSGLPPMASG